MGRRPPASRDVICVAGLTVAIVALPLALAFGVASGLGATAGLITAIVAGILAAIFGGSNLQVSGPTGAMTVVLIPVVHQFGTNGVLMVGLLAGAVLVVAAFCRLGRAARYLPAPVIEGFTAGIAVVIILQQVPAMFGTAGTGDKAWQSAFDAFRNYLANPTLASPLDRGRCRCTDPAGGPLAAGHPGVAGRRRAWSPWWSTWRTSTSPRSARCPAVCPPRAWDSST